MMAKADIKKGMRLVFVDFLGLVIGILNGFFLPMVFSIDGYALFRTFSLYATYAVVFSFGLSDGLYLMYGGKDEKDLDASRTKAYYFFLMKLQAVVCAAMFVLSWFVLNDTALIFFSLFITPLQLIHFFRLYYRALGEFDKYSFLQSILVVFELLNTLFIVFYVRSQSPHLFISIKIVNHVIVSTLLSMLFLARYKGIGRARLKWSDYYAVMKPGFAVLMADVVAALIFSLDRWFIKALFTNADFAYYSFAVSMLNLFLVFITSVTNIFYSYISKRIEDDNYIRNLKNIVLVISSFFPAGYFILEYIIKAYLSNYSEALEVLWILMLTLPFISIINVLYINLYKASKSIKVYLIKITVVLGISFVLNIVAYMIFSTAAAIAWATFVSLVVWYFYSTGDFQGIGINMKEVGYLLFLFISFFIFKGSDMGLALSLLSLTAALAADVLIFYRKDIIHIFGIIRENVYTGKGLK
ncbi:MAG TPA: hypothetical protein VEG39_11865 [Clostridia bacterium]|nr:hypothetical protein [Clostridia bacterium]